MMKRALLLLAVCLTACSAQTSGPSEDARPRQESARIDARFRAELDEFDGKKWPGSTIKGITEPRHRFDFLLLTAEVINPDQSIIVHLAAQQFFKDERSSYWRFTVVQRDLYYEAMRSGKAVVMTRDGDGYDPFE